VKTCTKCGIKKELTEFYKDSSPRSPDGLTYTCKTCRKASALAWNRKHVARANERRTAYEATDRAKRMRLNRVLVSSYDITVDEYEQLLRVQNEVCGICGEGEPDGKRLSVDHCHVTNVVRGLLCFRCNTSLERLEVVKDWSEKAAKYMKQAEKRPKY
jgi:Recombination endonuclease VII